VRVAAALVLAMLVPGAAGADDFVRSDGKHSDGDFFRLIACGRKPGGTCQVPIRRWTDDLARDLTVSRLADVDAVLPVTAAQIDAALTRAINEINGVGAGVQLRRIEDNAVAPIRLSIRSPRTMAAVSGETKRARVPVGMVVLDHGTGDRITGANILIGSDIPLTEVNSVVLEELVQSLGLLFDIDNTSYNRLSIFAQNSNGVTRLTGQDATALRLLYPPPP
jgi:hypothetical protein